MSKLYYMDNGIIVFHAPDKTFALILKQTESWRKLECPRTIIDQANYKL